MQADLDLSRLTRQIHDMPPEVKTALEESGLIRAYGARPAYQRNDYIGWIIGAKRPATRQKRLQQMLTELREGGVYMRMRWNGSSKRASDGHRPPGGA